jgi:hypothetical protein
MVGNICWYKLNTDIFLQFSRHSPLVKKYHGKMHHGFFGAVQFAPLYTNHGTTDYHGANVPPQKTIVQNHHGITMVQVYRRFLDQTAR